jgi:hypothetical protein
MKTLKEKFGQYALTQTEMQAVKGGVSREEYCATNAQIMQYCWSVPDHTCLQNGAAAWQTHCQPYGL